MKSRMDRLAQADEKVYYIYERIGSELGEQLSTLEQLTDLIQIFKDNDLVALRAIYEKRNGHEMPQERRVNAG